MREQDIQIVEQLKNGDLSAFDALYTKYYKVLCVSAYFFIHDEDASKDLVQTLFVDIWEKKLYLNFHNDIKGYLYCAIKNRCLNHIATHKTRDRNQRAFGNLQETNSPSCDELTIDYYGQLHTTLGTLTGRKRMAIQMVYLNGKRYQEAANEMGISINSFKTHLKAGLKILRFGVKNIKND